MEKPKRLILALTGASGAIYGLRALQILRALEIEVILILSPTGAEILSAETQTTPDQLITQANIHYKYNDLTAPISSGSYPTDGMLVVPCSIKSLSGIANSYGENLIQRAADVCLKEGRPLLLAVRETPLHSGHLRLMTQAAQAGAIIFPPVPTFYDNPQTIASIVDATVGRMLARIGIENEFQKTWGI